MGNGTYKVDAANSVNILMDDTELSVKESVETLHSGAEMPKRKSRPQHLWLEKSSAVC